MIASDSVLQGTPNDLSRGFDLAPFAAPTLALLLTACLCHVYGVPSVFEGKDTAQLASLGGTMASVGATMLGFLLASAAVIASINHTHLVSMMRQTGYYTNLLLTVLVSGVMFLLCTAIGMGLSFGMKVPQWFAILTVGLHVAAFVSLCDVGRKFWLVLSNLRDG